MTPEHITYTSGNIKELWKTSLPLMFSWLSVVLMTFVDRLYLARYSTEALNSTVTSGTIAMAFTYGLQTLCEMGGVLVAQYNGAKQFKQIGPVIWQVLWVTLFSFAFFVPLSWWGSDFLFANSCQGSLEKAYFSTLTLFGPALGLIGSISGFYIGRGFTSVITKVVIVGNISNLCLDPLLIFGWGEGLPAMGIKGAALATGISWVVQGVILLGCFIRPNNRKTFYSSTWRLDPLLLKDCLRIGLPTTLFIVLEIGGWGVFYMLMREAGSTHILVAGICQTILFLFVFVGCGVQKGIAAIAGNLIGAQKTEHLSQLMWSGVSIITGYFLLTCIPLILFPDFLINWFVQNPAALEGAAAADLECLKPLLRFGLGCTCIYLYLEDLRMVFAGILSGAGDTFFLMISGVIAVWLFLLTPSYVLIMQHQASVEVSIGIWVFYSLSSLLLPLYRFYFGKWGERKALATA